MMNYSFHGLQHPTAVKRRKIPETGVELIETFLVAEVS